MAGLDYNNYDDAFTLPQPATRATARYGIRRPRHNSYASIIHSQAPVLPTNATKVTARDGCRRGACSRTAASNKLLETRESLCGDCYQNVRGPGQPAWVSSYDDSLHQLMIDSETRDRLIRQSYVDLANQSNQVPSKPVLCKALARLYGHSPGNPLRRPPGMDEQDYRVQRWYEKNCYPYMTPAGSVAFFERALPRREAVDNILRQLGPMISSFGCCNMRQTYGQPCPCAPESGERAVYARRPTQMDIKRYQDQFAQQYRRSEENDQRSQMRRLYGLVPEGEQGNAVLQEQQNLVRDQRALRDMANPDYDQRIYNARVDQHRRQQIANQQRMNSVFDRTGNILPVGQGQ